MNREFSMELPLQRSVGHLFAATLAEKVAEPIEKDHELVWRAPHEKTLAHEFQGWSVRQAWQTLPNQRAIFLSVSQAPRIMKDTQTGPVVLLTADSISCVLRICWQLTRTTRSPGRTPINAAGESDRTELTASPLSEALPLAPNHAAALAVAADAVPVG
jgi:hypothetical protein